MVTLGGSPGARGASRRHLHVQAAIVAVGGAVPATHGMGGGGVRHGVQGHGGLLASGGADGPSNHGTIKASPVEHAALSAEVIGRVDDAHSCPGGIDGDRFRRRLDPDHLAVPVLKTMVCHRLDPPVPGAAYGLMSRGRELLPHHLPMLSFCFAT